MFKKTKEKNALLTPEQIKERRRFLKKFLSLYFLIAMLFFGIVLIFYG